MADLFSSILASVAQGNPVALLVLCLVAALTEVGIPSLFVIDTVLLFVGYQLGFLSLEVWLVMLALFVGRLAGSSVIYWLARVLGQPFLPWLEKRAPHICKQLNAVAGRLSQRAPVAVATARLTPGLLTGASVGAGLVRIKYSLFALGIALSSLIADGALLLVGFLTRRGTSLFGIQPTPLEIAIGALVTLYLGWGIYFLLRRLRTKKSSLPIPADALKLLEQ
jgi:membrane protein DedA with SNARE-associated domain